MTPILVFDLETIPDIAGIRRVYDVPAAASDDEVSPGLLISAARRPAAISRRCTCSAWSRSDACCAKARRCGSGRWASSTDPEPELLRRFFDGVERYTPQLVSWNGGGFDLPVLNHRALIHGVAAPRYWDWGDDDREFKFNSYLGRFHTRHLDLMDVLAAFQPRASAGLDAMARLCGFPGKLGMDGSAVADAVAAGRLADVRNYCETDVMNTYLVYQRFRLMRGEIDAGEYAREISLARERVATSDAPHWREFLAAWDSGSKLNAKTQGAIAQDHRFGKHGTTCCSGAGRSFRLSVQPATSIVFPLLILALTNSPAAAGVASGAARGSVFDILLAGRCADRSLGPQARDDLLRRRARDCRSDRAGRLVAGRPDDLADLPGGFHRRKPVCVFNIAEVAALPRVVPAAQLPQAAAQNEAAFGAVHIAGPSIGTFLYQALGKGAPFIADAISYVMSVVSLLLIKTEFRRTKVSSGGPCGPRSSRACAGCGISR